MPDACCLFRSGIAYGRDEFAGGLAALGYRVSHIAKHRPDPEDVLLVWNRRRAEDSAVDRYRRAGARIVVAENGFIRASNEKAKSYALALEHHNGAGRWPVGGGERFAMSGIELHPWRSVGDHVLMLPQRGIGEKGIAQPPGWAHTAFRTLEAATDRPVRLRRHPGPAKTEPYAELEGAHAAVTWASGAAIKALAFGIPVFYGLDRWIGAGAALPLGSDLEEPLMDDARRLAMFERLAWAQWSIAEIVTGEAFEWLLQSTS